MGNDTVNNLLEVAKTGTEADVKEFIQDNWIDFPIDIQDALAVALMTDAVREKITTTFGEALRSMERCQRIGSSGQR